jgi:branched-chain amino acid transport system permease protein
MIFVEQTLQTLVAGLSIGCIYGLLCVGLALIFGIMRVINFAQGDLMMVGMYVAIFIAGFILPSAALGTVGPFLAALAVGPMMFIFGYLLSRYLISQASGMKAASLTEGDAHQAQLILTLGLALILQNGRTS